jgi:hypothetical protein
MAAPHPHSKTVARQGNKRSNMKSYSAPNAGDYNAPTPHASKVAQEIFTAPEADLNQLAHTGFDMAENGLGAPTKPGG